MNDPVLILSSDMVRYDDIIGYVNQLHPEKGFNGILSATASAQETRVILPYNICFCGTLPNQRFFHSMLMMSGAEFGFYLINPEMLPLIRIVPKNEMWEFLLLMDDVSRCWMAGYRPIGSNVQLEPYDFVELRVPEEMIESLRVIPDIAYGGA